MKLLIDAADVQEIRRIYEYYPVDGVTTNPSILAKCGLSEGKRDPYAMLKEIRSIIGRGAELHIQVISRRAEDMVKEAHTIRQRVKGNTFVKIPAVEEGLKAMKQLSREGVPVTATAVYTLQQAFLAGKAGALYAAPYVNRMDDLGQDGVQTTKRIHDLFQRNGMETQVLAASFKNTHQLLELAEYGVGAATAAPDVLEKLCRNGTVDSAVDAFIEDFESLCGEGKTMLTV